MKRRPPRMCYWLPRTGDETDPQNWRDGLVPDPDFGDTVALDPRMTVMGEDGGLRGLSGIIAKASHAAAIKHGAQIDKLGDSEEKA